MNGLDIAVVDQAGRSHFATCQPCTWAGPKYPGPDAASIRRALVDRDFHNQVHHGIPAVPGPDGPE